MIDTVKRALPSLVHGPYLFAFTMPGFLTAQVRNRRGALRPRRGRRRGPGGPGGGPPGPRAAEHARAGEPVVRADAAGAGRARE